MEETLLIIKNHHAIITTAKILAAHNESTSLDTNTRTEVPPPNESFLIKANAASNLSLGSNILYVQVQTRIYKR
jgi:hypothetical protein